MLRKTNLARRMGGDIHAHTRQKNTFKPLVASSLAIALGFGVASATITNPTIQANGSDFTYLSGVWDGENVANQSLEWVQSSDGLINLKKVGASAVVSNIEIKFDKTKDPQRATLWGEGGVTFFPNSKVANPVLTFNSQGNGIKLGADGGGTLTTQFALLKGQPKNSHANVIIRNESGDDALQGNLLIIGGYGNWDPAPSTPNLNATFYGNLVGNFNQEVRDGGWTPYSEVVFEKGNITGNVTVSAGGMTLKFAEGGVQGNVTINTPGNSVSTAKFIRTSNSDLSIGKTGGFIQGKLYTAGGGVTNFTVGYDVSAQGGTKVISLNPEDKTKFEITKGSFAFYNMKALNFTDDSNNKKTFTLKTGTIDDATFTFDRAIIEGTQTKTLRAGGEIVTPVATIVTGNLSAQDGKSIRLSLIDNESITEAPSEDTLKTLKVDGSITITNGGLSLFYNDRLNCFEAKVQATDGITQTGGYIGRNDAFFETGTFTNDKKNISTIQATVNGVSHLRFNDNVTIQDGISATSGNGTELFFYKGVAITNGTNSHAISGNGSNTIYLGGTNTITGNLDTNAGSITINQEENTPANLTLTDSTIKAYGGGTANIVINVDNLTISGTSNLVTNGVNSYSTNKNKITAQVANISLASISANWGGGNEILIDSVGESGFTVAGRIDAQNNASNTITIKSGNFQVDQGIIAQTYNASSQNIITLESGNLIIGGNTSDGNKAVYAKNGTDNTNNSNTINVNGDLTINGVISVQAGKNEISFTGDGLVAGNIQTDGHYGGQNIFHLSGDSTTLKLQGQNNNITTLMGYTAPTQGGVRNGVGYATLILDGANATAQNNNGVSATITNALNSGAIAINFNGDADNTAKLTLSAGGNAIQGIILGSETNTDSTNNTLTLSQGTTTIITDTVVGDTQALTFDFANGAGVNLTNNISNAGTANINFNGTNGILTGTLETTDGTTTINVADGKSGSISGAITTTGGATNIAFGTGTSDKALTLQNTGNTLSSITLASGSTNNTLTLSTGTTSITGKTAIANGQALTFDFANGAGVNLTNNISNAGTANINFNGTNGILTGTLETTDGTTTINVADGKSGSISGTVTTEGGATNVTFGSSGNGGSLTLQGQNIAVSSVTTNGGGSNILAFDGNNNDITATITTLNPNNAVTLKLISASDTVRSTPTNTSLTLSNAVSSNVNVVFEGGVADQIHFSTLTLGGASNTLDSVTSNAKNAKILLNGTTSATITNTTIGSGSSLIFAFTGAGASSVTASSPITVGSGATLGISLGGSDAQTKSIGGSITFDKSSTLLIDFQNGNASNGSIGNGNAIVIEDERNSIINFHGTNTGQLNGSGITIDGGTNTVNFIGTATMSGVTLTSGTNTFNVYGSDSADSAITGTLASSQVDLGSITNTINLEDYATFKVGDSGADALTTAGTNTIHFKGVSSKLHGSLDSDGTTTIKIANGKSGVITGNIEGDGTTNVEFEALATPNQGRFARLASPTTLALQGTNNVISDVKANNAGKLILDTANNAVTATISSAIIGDNLTAQFNGDTSKVATLNLNGGKLAVEINSGAVDENILNLQSDVTTVTGGISVGADKGITIRLDESASGVVDGNITGDGSTKVAYGSGAGSKTLTLKGASNTITSVDATYAGTLSLNGEKNKAETTLASAISTDKLTVNLSGNSDGTQGAELTLANDTNTIASLTLGSSEVNGGRSASKGNKLILVGDTTTINNAVSVGANQAITFDLGGANLALTSGLSNAGNAEVNFNGTNGILSSAITTNGENAVTTINVGDNTGTITGSITTTNGATNVSFGNNGILKLQGENNTLTSVSATTSGKLILDTTNNAVMTTISSAITGDNLTAQFNGTATYANTLNLNGGKLAIEINSGAVDENLLNLQSETTTVVGGISVGAGKGITISLDNANLISDLSNGANLDLTFFGSDTLTGEIDTTAGTTNINAKNGATATITGEVKGSGITQATLEANSTLNLVSNATLSIITMDSTSKLDLSNAVGTHSDKNTSYSFNELNASGANVILYSEANKARSRIDARGVQTSDKYYTLLKIGGNGKGLVGDNTTFTLHLDNTKYDNVYLGGVKQDGTPNNGDQYGHTYADRIVIEKGSGANGKITDIKLKIIPKLDELGEISYQGGGTETEGNIAILTVKNGITENVESVQSVEVAGVNTQVNITSSTTDITGNSSGNGYTTYFAGSAKVASISEGIKEIASTALTVNYDLFLANFNSLNKRMGELRDNPHSQGVWARVYGGAMSNDFGAGSKSEYVTAQGGYDYSLTLGDAKNYMGIAVAYGHSTTKSNQIQNAVSNVGVGQATGLQDVNSNMVEVGIYNSYVMDSGWYNDTIFKFDYIMSTFTMTDNTALESETNNFAMILSNEFGYRYKFGKDSSWYIDPQLEVGFGYFNQSDFNRVIFDHINQQSADIKATQDTILTLRGRAGLSLGKKFTTDKGFASLYVGAFYEYDYIEGGNASASSFGVINAIDSIESNGRAIVNIGSNIELTDGVRMYIDVEKSFGDKQRTDMQFNFGARYSFGEKAPTVSYQEQQKKSVAPLKVEESKTEQNTQESETEAQADTEAKQ